MTQEAIGKFIAKCREEQKLTQAMLGGRLNVSDKKVASWEEGPSVPGADLYEPLCRALDIQVSELLSGKKLKDAEKIERGEKSAGAIIATKAQIKLLDILSIVLVIIGIVAAVMVFSIPGQFSDKAFPFLLSLAAAGIGIAFRVLFGMIYSRFEKE